jgi:hypothetical protein
LADSELDIGEVMNFKTAMDTYCRDPDSYGLNMRLDLAALIIRGMKNRSWTIKDLADASDINEDDILSLLHSDIDCSFDIAGRILFSLNILPTITDEIRS